MNATIDTVNVGAVKETKQKGAMKRYIDSMTGFFKALSVTARRWLFSVTVILCAYAIWVNAHVQITPPSVFTTKFKHTLPIGAGPEMAIMNPIMRSGGLLNVVTYPFLGYRTDVAIVPGVAYDHYYITTDLGRHYSQVDGKTENGHHYLSYNGKDFVPLD